MTSAGGPGRDDASVRDALTTVHVRAAVKGDRASIEWIFRRFGPLLRAQAVWRLGRAASDHDVDDVLADAWLVVMPRLGDLEPREGRITPVILAFFGTTIRWLANARLRSRLRQAPVSDPADLRSSADQAAGRWVHETLQRLFEEETAARLREALDGLDELERAVVILRAVEGLGNKEIAEETGEHVNTVSRRYQRALQKLREALPSSVIDDVIDS